MEEKRIKAKDTQTLFLWALGTDIPILAILDSENSDLGLAELWDGGGGQEGKKKKKWEFQSLIILKW